jgi:dipeptide/tripeptide permease
MVAVGGALSMLGYVLLALVADPHRGGLSQVWWASAVEVSGAAFLLPALQSLLSRRTDPARQGGILGIGESVSAMARITGMIAGVALYHRDAALPFWTAGAVVGVGLLSASIALAHGRDWAEGDERRKMRDEK